MKMSKLKFSNQERKLKFIRNIKKECSEANSNVSE